MAKVEHIIHHDYFLFEKRINLFLKKLDKKDLTFIDIKYSVNMTTKADGYYYVYNALIIYK